VLACIQFESLKQQTTLPNNYQSEKIMKYESTTTTNLRIPFDRDCNPYLRVVASKKYAMQGRIAGVRRRSINRKGD